MPSGSISCAFFKPGMAAAAGFFGQQRAVVGQNAGVDVDLRVADADRRRRNLVRSDDQAANSRLRRTRPSTAAANRYRPRKPPGRAALPTPRRVAHRGGSRRSTAVGHGVHGRKSNGLHNVGVADQRAPRSSLVRTQGLVVRRWQHARVFLIVPQHVKGILDALLVVRVALLRALLRGESWPTHGSRGSPYLEAPLRFRWRWCRRRRAPTQNRSASSCPASARAAHSDATGAYPTSCSTGRTTSSQGPVLVDAPVQQVVVE